MNIDTTFLRRCIATLEYAFEALEKSTPAAVLIMALLLAPSPFEGEGWDGGGAYNLMFNSSTIA
jgi:hypothetical protein